MWSSKRARNQGKKRSIFYVFFFVVLIFVVSFLLIFFGHTFFSGNRYVSPLPKTNLTLKPTPVAPSKTRELEELLRKQHILFTRVTVASDSSYIIFGPSQEEILLSGKKDLLTQVSSLQLILSRLTIEGKAVSRLDIRFDKPIIVYR